MNYRGPSLLEGDNQQRAEGTEQDTRLLHGATWEENVLMKWHAMERLRRI